MFKLLPLILALSTNASALSYTTHFNLAKPTTGDTNYVTPFNTGMDTIDSTMYDLGLATSTALVKKSGDTMTGPLTTSSLTVTGSGSIGGSSFSVGVDPFVVTSGKVGIGTASPSERLEVKSADSTYARIENTGGLAAGLRLVGNGTTADWSIFLNRGDIFGEDNTLGFYKNTGTAGVKMVLKDSGNVGIGTTAPASKLHISSGTLTIDGTSPGFSVGGSTFVVTGGKVGVGTASPLSALSFGASGSVIGMDTTDGADNKYMSFSGGPIHDATRASSIYVSGNESSLGGKIYLDAGNISGGDIILRTGSTTERMRVTYAGSVGIGTTAPASTLQIGTSLNATTNYLQIDTLAADTAGPPAATDCDAATEVGRMVVSSRYTATADNNLWICMQTAASTYAWWKTAISAP